jgi:basic membrane lipoprotein Med (substrate-binding protein (PBP1-ABC) superfamily)
VIASAVTSIPEAFLKIAVEVKAGGFRPGMREFGMRDGMVKVIINPRLESRIPPAVMEQVKRAEQQLKGGAKLVSRGKVASG